MDICQVISNSKSCFIDEIVNYLDKLNHGENKDVDDIKMLAMYQIIDTLEKYNFHPKKEVVIKSVIVPECDILNYDTNSVILYKTKCIDVDPADVNCLKPEELCPMIEQLSIICENCNCDC